MTFGDSPFNLEATASSGLTVTYSVVAGSDFVALDGNTVTILGVGTVTIRASQAGNDDFNAATPIDQFFTISKANQEITFNPLDDKAFDADPFPLSATSDSGLTVSFSISTGSSLIDLSGNTVTINGAGNVTIRASQSGSANYNAASTVDQSFAIAKSDQTITFQPVTTKIVDGAPFLLSASADSNLAVAFSIVSGSGFVSLNGDTVAILGAGSVTIRASQAGNNDFNAATPDDQSFTINKADQTILFDPIDNLAVEESPFQLTAAATSGLSVIYTVVEGAGIAAVNGTTLTLSGEGQVTIEADQPGNENYNAAIEVSQSFLAISNSLECQDVFCGEDIPGFPGWLASPWYKNYNVEFLPWIFHDEHSWQFLSDTSTEDVIFVWDLGLGEWVFLNENSYRWIFLFGGENAGWVFTFGDNTPTRRFFQRLDGGTLFSVPPDLPVE